MKKILKLGLLLSVVLIVITACTTSISLTYNVETGDKIKVTLNTTEGYSMTSSIPFSITKDGNSVSDGTFITLEGYEQYKTIIDQDEKSDVIDSGSERGLEYIFYNFNDEEYNYIIKIEGSNTGVLLGNSVSEESAEACFDNLTFTKE